MGAADLDGDGRIEIAYVGPPRFTRILRVWRFDDAALREVASAAGFTNHRIGERDIAGGIRDRGTGPESVRLAPDRRRQVRRRSVRPHDRPLRRPPKLRSSDGVPLECCDAEPLSV